MVSRAIHRFILPVMYVVCSIRYLAVRFFAFLAMALLSLALAGCAAEMAYRDGKELVAQGKVEEGLAKFQDALAHDPRGVEYKAAYLQTRERAVAKYLEQADRLAAPNERTAAENLYRRVLAIDPDNERARTGLLNLDRDGRHAQLITEAEAAFNKKEYETAARKLSTVLSENPNNRAARALQQMLTARTIKPPVESLLSVAYQKPITIEFKDVALKQVFEVISRTSGLNFLFDKDVKTDQKTSIFLKNSTIESAVHFTLLTNQLEQQVIDANTILIYPNTVAKQKDYQEMVIKTFLLTNADAKSMANTLKTILKSRDIVTDERLNMLTVRDSPAAIKLAEKLVALYDVAEPEVMLEVEILEIKRTRLLELGIMWPNSLALTPLPSAAGGILTLRDLRHTDSGTLGAGLSPATIKARKEDSDTKILANPRIRARNHEKAKILIGERVPNITTTATATGFVSESISYVDVGLKLDVEPTVYLDNDVAIKISLEVSNIVSQLKTQSGSVAYQIGTRTASTVLRLKDGENQVLAGLINDEDRRSGNKIPALGDLPIIGRLFGSTLNDNQKTEIVLSITPHLIRNIQRPEATLSEFRSGTDSNFSMRPDTVSGAPTQAAPGPRLAASPTAPNDLPIAAPANSNNATTPPNINSTGGAVANPAVAPATAQLSWQGPPQAKVGSTFIVQLLMQPDQPITGLPMAVSFDNRVLQVVGIAEGDFLKQGGAQTSFTSRVDPNGQILMAGTRTGSGGATGTGVVAAINFRALAPADASPVQLLTVAPVGVAGHAVIVPLPAPYAIQVQP